MKKSDYAQFLTEEMLKHMHMTKEEKLEKKQLKSKGSSHWFGLLPLAIKMIRRKNKK
ncbi:YqzE family protein [Halobacillus massiliensis]|uniref:YqzE family protein n=1 Tax=Halobacillus massiliensis TaxID=1926286 RepID=UPI0009E503B0|nr:YqzE family protein [Halobacillus massiliensis]